MALRLNNTLRNDHLTNMLTAIGATGKVRIYDGAKPGTKGGAPAGTLLAEVALVNPAGTVSGGVLTFTMPQENNAAASGTGTFFVILSGADAFVVDGDVGSDMTISGALVAGNPFRITSLTITAGNN